MVLGCAIALLVGVCCATARAAFPDNCIPLTARTPAAATQSTKRTAFQPGVQIDWAAGEVILDVRIAVRRGPLEFLACFAGKEHESIALCRASATHVFMALGLIGLTPGTPPRWDDEQQRFIPPSGDLVDVFVEYPAPGESRSGDDRGSTSGVAGRTLRINACDWLLEREYDRAALRRPWIFAGSIRLSDGALAADRSGAGIAIVHMPDCLLAMSRDFSDKNSDLWALANSPAIPEDLRDFKLVLRAAALHEHHVRVDALGDVWVDDQWTEMADLADLILLRLRQTPDYVQPIALEGCLQSDAAAIRRQLVHVGVPAGAIRVGAGG